MNQEKINKINDAEFELMYNSLFGTPISVSINKSSNCKYVNFIVNRLISGDTNKLQTVELNKKTMSNALQEKKSRVMELLVLNKSNDKIFKNDNAKTDIKENIKHSVNFPTKFVTMTQSMYSNLKADVQSEFVRNFAKNMVTLRGQNLLSDNALEFATEKMMNVDNKFKNILSNEIEKGQTQMVA